MNDIAHLNKGPFWLDDGTAADAGGWAAGQDFVMTDEGLPRDHSTADLPPTIAPGWAADAAGSVTLAPVTANADPSQSTAVTDGPATATNPAGAPYNTSALALYANVATSTYGVTGSGIVIGILSDSFQSGATGALSAQVQTAIADGLLPANFTLSDIVSDSTAGANEGLAMAEMVHEIAPGATIYFYSGEGGQQAYAAGIATLATTYHCNIIIDDLSYLEEPFFQDGGIVQKAVQNAITLDGVNYFTAAGNSSNSYFETSFTALSGVTTLTGVSGSHAVADIGNGTDKETFTVAAGATANIDMQWNQPFASLDPGKSSAYTLAIAIYDSTGNLVETLTPGTGAGDPVTEGSLTNSSGAQATYSMVVYLDTGTLSSTPSQDLFKVILVNSQASFTGYGVGTGDGTMFGHELASGVNAVGAVNYQNTPQYQAANSETVTTPVNEGFSSYGDGTFYRSPTGTPLPTPAAQAGVTFSATDATATSVSGFGTFYGSSAAAPNAAAVAALVLQEDTRLATAQVSYLLEQSATPTTSALQGGAGLINANLAVASADTAATTPIWTKQAGTLVWGTAGNWSDNAVPTSANAEVTIGNGLGLLSGAFTVAFDPASATIQGLLVDGGSLATPTLSVASSHALVASSVTLGAGHLDIGGRLSISGSLQATSATGTVTLEPSGTLGIGGSDGAAIVMAGANAVIAFNSASSSILTSGLTGAISGFVNTDTIDLSGLAYNALDLISDVAGVVSIESAASVLLAEFKLATSVAQLFLRQDSTGGTAVVACFASGTGIDTPEGQVPVETLQAGDRVTLSAGGSAAIRWIGWRRLTDPDRTTRPMRIAAGTFGDGQPRRDLLLSPEHAVFADNVLVPIGALSGCPGISQPAAAEVTYFHILLDRHDVVLAEGLPCETLLDTEEPFAFANAATAPDSLAFLAPCAPRVTQGPALEAIRRRITARAGVMGAPA